MLKEDFPILKPKLIIPFLALAKLSLYFVAANTILYYLVKPKLESTLA